ncbi:MAG TPA: 23S rRNA (guanosine(2251)-2'-O)-methyltransferase RlmB [Bacteroidia bacterium]|nr:23S rRNA (guanosine(2251)-2'-O)-methyltransferase RlmB [Bacteroidia bacterium]
MYENKRNTSEQSNLLFGLRPVIEAINSGKEIDKLFVQSGLSGGTFHELKKLLAEKNIYYQYVPIEKLNRLTSKNHQGVVCVLSEISYQHIDEILPWLFENGKNPLILILDRITDVRNFGAIARSAECAGADAIVIPARGAAQVNGDAMKTSAGALHKIPVCRSENLKETIEYLKNSGVQIMACTEKASDYYYSADFSLPTAIIMGSEEDGISPEYLKRSDVKIRIPLMGEIGSLNVSVATGIVLYEAVKQRMK